MYDDDHDHLNKPFYLVVLERFEYWNLEYQDGRWDKGPKLFSTCSN